MKPFSFGLQKVLDLRKHHEDEARIELGRAIGILAGIEGNIRAVGQERVRAAEEQYSLSGGELAEGTGNLVQMRQYAFYILRLDNTKEQLLKDAALAELKVEETREAFLQASSERKVLDKLKEKRQKEYRKEFFAEETKTLDDNPARTGIW
jgi:flagellar FliJ protein